MAKPSNILPQTAILDAYVDGSLLDYLQSHPRRVKQGAAWELHLDEAILLEFLQQRETK